MKTLRQNTGVGSIIIATLAVFVLTACGSGEWGEIEDIVTDQADITEAYVAGLEKAQSAEDMAEVINEFTDGMKTLIPKIKTFQEAHPEFWTGGEEVPEKIKVQQERLEAASTKIQGAFMNMMTYMMDPKVQEAMMNMSTEMAKLE
jgi:hypothetical protein